MTAARSLVNFERAVNPVIVRAISTDTIDELVAARRREQGQKPNTRTSLATINRDLRYIRAHCGRPGRGNSLSTFPNSRS